MTLPLNLMGTGGVPPSPLAKENPLMTQAKELEIGFLSEMLGYAGFGKSLEGFDGGVGEDQFSSFLRDAQARKMVNHGGIGLAEQIFQSLVKGQANDR